MKRDTNNENNVNHWNYVDKTATRVSEWPDWKIAASSLSSSQIVRNSIQCDTPKKKEPAE